jgi:hypothetical protein
MRQHLLSVPLVTGGGMKRTLLVPIFALTVVSFLIACGGPTSSSSHQSSAVDRQRAWLQYASCLRQQGANEPDPSFDGDGNPSWLVDPKTLPNTAVQACSSYLRSAGLSSASHPSASYIASEARFSACIRQHGVADFPDPDGSGNFPTNGDPTQQPGWGSAFQACKSLLPSGKP